MGLRELRQERGLTLEAIAYLAGDDVDISTISRIENGKVTPKPETVVKLARALGTSVTRMRTLIAEGAEVETLAEVPK